MEDVGELQRFCWEEVGRRLVVMRMRTEIQGETGLGDLEAGK